MKKRPPTDLEIWKQSTKDTTQRLFFFAGKTNSKRQRFMYLFDIEAIAKHFSIDPDIVFGRLYYHLEPKYGFAQADGSKVYFFALQAGSDKHSVQFPLLAAVIAGLREERNRHLAATWISIAAIIISIISLISSLSSR